MIRAKLQIAIRFLCLFVCLGLDVTRCNNAQTVNYLRNTDDDPKLSPNGLSKVWSTVFQELVKFEEEFESSEAILQGLWTMVVECGWKFKLISENP